MVTIVINEQHALLPDQEKVLAEKFGRGTWSTLSVPASGWTLEEMRVLADRFNTGTVVFLSPVPALLLILADKAGYQAGVDMGSGVPPQEPPLNVMVFHNDHRVARELPGGKIVHTVSPDGWILV